MRPKVTELRLERGLEPSVYWEVKVLSWEQ
jgi:hypothetical protein